MLARAQCTAAPPAAALARPALGRSPSLKWRAQRRSSLAVRATPAAGSSGSAGNVGSSSEDRSGLSEAQLQAEAERLLLRSKEALQGKSRLSDDTVQQRMALLLLRLGFSQAAIEAAVKRERRTGRPGGPYIAEQHISEAVALLRRWGFSQQQLDSVLAGSSTFTRAAADIEAVLAWLQREFGLQAAEVAQACSRNPALLALRQTTLEASWRALEAEYRPTAVAKGALACALRQGNSIFLQLKLGTVREKVGQLQQLFQVPDSKVPAYIGHMALLFRSDITATVQPRLAFLQTLTGVPTQSLAERVLRYPTLLQLSEELLQRNRDALVATLGKETAAAVSKACPHVLAGAEDRAALNIASLQQLFGVTREDAMQILQAYPRLLLYDMQSDAVAAMLRGRVAFWQQAYGLPSAEVAAVRCCLLLPYRLVTVAPRAAFYQHQHPGEAMPSIFTFTKKDENYCRRCKLDQLEFAAFKAQWLASEEGRAVCRHERKLQAKS